MRWEIDRHGIAYTQIHKNISETERVSLLKEYEICVASVEAQTENFLKATNLVIPFVTASLPIGLYLQKDSFGILEGVLTSLALAIFNCLFLNYYAKQSARLYRNAFKIVLLRKVLNFPFHFFKPVLPQDEVESAINPFEIKMFTGWLSLYNLPLVFIALVASISIFVVSSFYLEVIESMYVSLASVLLFVFVIRRLSLDKFENMDLVFFKWFFNDISKIKLEKNFGWPLYNAWMNINEIQRLNLDLTNLRSMLIFIEDRRFLKHKGVSLLSISRALISVLFCKNKRMVGASTITQQLIRTLFVVEYSKTLRRKLVEVSLAFFWIEKIYTKNELMKLYLSAVRFEKDIYGANNAIKYYFNRNNNFKPSLSESFFLIERIGNTRSGLLTDRITCLIKQALHNNLISKSDAIEIVQLYLKQYKSSKVLSSEENVDNFISQSSSLLEFDFKTGLD